MKKIWIINTGGTIAMSKKDDESLSLKAGQNLLHTYLSDLPYEVKMEDFLNIPSPHMTPDILLRLRNHIIKHEKNYDGIVITHGTDTLEETAYFLEITTDMNKPIVITGAMKSSDETMFDGFKNLKESVLVAGDIKSTGRGVLVVFNGDIHHANHVKKTHTSDVSAFSSLDKGVLGGVSKNDVYYNVLPNKRKTYLVQHANAKVPIIKPVIGMDRDWYLSFLDKIDAVVIEGYGYGNVPPDIIPFIKKLIKMDKPVVLISRCHEGRIGSVYDYDGSGKRMKEIGVILANDLSVEKARLKLIVLKSLTNNLGAIEKEF